MDSGVPNRSKRSAFQVASGMETRWEGGLASPPWPELGGVNERLEFAPDRAQFGARPPNEGPALPPPFLPLFGVTPVLPPGTAGPFQPFRGSRSG
jgi:hypothetical protein